jgi:quercetin dioxygenase-like cupin family protein
MAETTETETRTEGALKAGPGRNIFDLAAVAKIEAGTGYSSAIGGVIEGVRTQCGLIHKARGTGARLHAHPNEQWNYILKGRMRVSIEGEEDRIVGPGTLIYFPPNVVHATVALPEEDVIFFVVKDLTHGIMGRAADGTMAGAHYEPGFAPEAGGSSLD